MMKQDWNRFIRTGTVQDYLIYKQQESLEQNQNSTKEQQGDNSHHGDGACPISHTYG